MKNKEWKLIAHSSQIADTGDYDGHWELTNGDIKLITNDDIDESAHDTGIMLFELSQYNWENVEPQNKEYELYLEKEKRDRLTKFLKAIGVPEVMIDKVTYVGADGIDIVNAIDQIKKL